MLELPSAAARRKAGSHGRFKADVYRMLDALLFIEREERQALEIARLSNKPVLSIETQSVIDPARLAELPFRLKLSHAGGHLPHKLRKLYYRSER